MNNFIGTPGVDENKDLIPLPIQDTTNEQVGKFEFISGVQDTVVHNITPNINPETTKVINYLQLKKEHAKLIAQGKASVEIGQWIGDKLNIPSWKSGEFHGERKVLSSPKTPEESARLQKFIRALGAPRTKANGGSDNYSQHLLLDTYAQYALFGQANMIQMNTRLGTFHADWEKMGDDFDAKTEYLMKNVGLDIKGDWSKLTGIRDAFGDFSSSDVLESSGSLDVDSDVYVLRMDMHGSHVSFYNNNPSFARLCFLA